MATLPPGDYLIRVHDKLLNKEIFEVADAKSGKVYCNFLAVPQSATGRKDSLTFWPGNASAKAIRAWYIASDGQGWEFVYPKEKAVALAKSAGEAVPAVDLSTMPTPNNPLLSSDDLRAVQLWLLTPKRVGSAADDNVQIAAAKLTPEPVVRARRSQAAAMPVETQRMPQTASNFLGDIIAGFLLLASALWMISRQFHRADRSVS